MPALQWALPIVGAVLLGLVVLVSLGTLIFSYVQARMLLTPVRRPLELRPADVGLAAEDVWIPSPRGRLAAWYVPARNDCTLICCHGINDNRGQWVAQVARLHHERGYGAVMFDFAGHGESEGELVTYGVREQEDVAAVLAYLRSRGDVEMRGVGIMGYSLGAITAVLTAAAQPELQAVVIESGFADVQRDLSVLFHRFTGLPSFPFANLVVFWGERIGRGKVRLSQIRPVKVIGQIAPRAIFIISDLDDAIADEPYDGEHLYAHAGEPKRLWQVPGVQHVQAFVALPDEWVALVGNFLDEHLAEQVAAQVAREARTRPAGSEAGNAPAS
jgi:pimeloyl-ACP methyl ester carboxylesterase